VRNTWMRGKNGNQNSKKVFLEKKCLGMGNVEGKKEPGRGNRQRAEVPEKAVLKKRSKDKRTKKT